MRCNVISPLEVLQRTNVFSPFVSPRWRGKFKTLIESEIIRSFCDWWTVGLQQLIIESEIYTPSSPNPTISVFPSLFTSAKKYKNRHDEGFVDGCSFPWFVTPNIWRSIPCSFLDLHFRSQRRRYKGWSFLMIGFWRTYPSPPWSIARVESWN